MTSGTLDENSARHLIELCRQGRLYEVEAWIRAGSPVNVPGGFRNSPLLTAIDRGFHSLVALLLRHGSDTEVNESALELAVRVRHDGIVQLLIEHGVPSAEGNCVAPANPRR